MILEAIGSPTLEREQTERYELLKSRYERVKEVLKEKQLPGISSYPFSPLPYNSGYFMCIELHPTLDAEKVRQILLKNYDTGVIAVKNLLRIAYSSVPKDNIMQLFENIFNACEEAYGKHSTSS